MITRRDVIRTLGGLVMATCGGSAAYGFGWEPRSLHLARRKIALAGWRGHRPLKIAAVSDLHIGGPNVPVSRLPGIVEALNGLDPDVTFLLGDFIASRRPRPDDPPMAAWAQILGGLRARNGVFAILGNHDWWHDDVALAQRSGPTQVGKALDAAGITVLENRALRIETEVTPLWLAGLGDQIAFETSSGAGPGGADDLAGTLAQVADDGAPLILLAHEPDIFVRVPSRALLTLSGHTHGGQLRLFGWSPFVPSRYGNRFAYGHIVEQDRNLVVSSGVGTSRIPLRLGIPPEIMLIEIGA